MREFDFHEGWLFREIHAPHRCELAALLRFPRVSL
jgi:hypothetical protein